MTRSDIRPGYTIKLKNRNIFIVYMVGNTKYICLPRTHYISTKLSNVFNEDLSPVRGNSPIIRVWDNNGKLVYEREKTITLSMEQIAKMLNIPVEELRIKD